MRWLDRVQARLGTYNPIDTVRESYDKYIRRAEGTEEPGGPTAHQMALFGATVDHIRSLPELALPKDVRAMVEVLPFLYLPEKEGVATLARYILSNVTPDRVDAGWLTARIRSGVGEMLLTRDERFRTFVQPLANEPTGLAFLSAGWQLFLPDGGRVQPRSFIEYRSRPAEGYQAGSPRLLGLSSWIFFGAGEEVQGGSMMENPTTVTDCFFSWIYDGDDAEVEVTIVELSQRRSCGPFKCHLRDCRCDFLVNQLQDLWHDHRPEAHFQVAVQIRTEAGVAEAGPYEVPSGVRVEAVFDPTDQTWSVTATTTAGEPVPDECIVLLWSSEEDSDDMDVLLVQLQNGRGAGKFDTAVDPEAVELRLDGPYPEEVQQIEVEYL
jgi:hypothetical protein